MSNIVEPYPLDGPTQQRFDGGTGPRPRSRSATPDGHSAGAVTPIACRDDEPVTPQRWKPVSSSLSSVGIDDESVPVAQRVLAAERYRLGMDTDGA
jgi:hypothetical protein